MGDLRECSNHNSKKKASSNVSASPVTVHWATIEPTNRLERQTAQLLLCLYKRRLRGIVEAAPAWVSEEILSASEPTGDDRAVLWMRKN
jgi:hypothetical protein